ncbi:uncharacterized protein RSE6_09736 [Rhynchosporium secalis]|uniref:F-box domain-containing protein n=1 Tax=Rhynchosporium secalis TaxID=38038 RepID=A0A1E1MIR2_RHYSE|nr:uncharacterized protein RSE6_09736 [Rhynchosporium secalis]
MSITTLSTEILQKIYDLSELQDLLAVSRTCKRTYRVFIGRKMHLLTRGLHNSYSPLPSLLKLTLANEPDKSRRPIGTEIRIDALLSRVTSVPPIKNLKLTLEQMKKMVYYGRIADRWTELYPRLRWRVGSDSRRLLHGHEKERLRRAIYHHWTYTSLFHSRTYTSYSPYPPSPASHDDPRHRLLRTYSTTEHIQLSELLVHLEQLVELDLYPSNSVIRSQDPYSESLPTKAIEKIAWGEGSAYRRLVRDIMKLSPADLLHLVENTSTKIERLDFLYKMEACFGDVPATMNYALSTVSTERFNVAWGMSVKEIGVVGHWVHFPSLRSRIGIPRGLHRGAVEIHGVEEDLADEGLRFGICDVVLREGERFDRDELGRWGLGIDFDGVETGEWEGWRRLAGLKGGVAGEADGDGEHDE